MRAATSEPLERDRIVYRWDLDKTYLRTEFDTLADLVRTAIEPPSRKRTVPGAAALLRELRRARPRAIHILSGSPEQMRSRLEAKLRLDGIVWDSFVLKPTLKNVLKGRFRFVREQLGYKLSALVGSRMRTELDSAEILFGDDAEADAYVYSLYADIVAGTVEVATLLEILRRAHVHPEDAADLVRMASKVPRADPVRKIFIHLDRISPSLAFDSFGPRVCPFYNYFQPALVLLDSGLLDVEAVLRVAEELVVDHGFDADALAASHAELATRGQVGDRVVAAFEAARPTLEPRRFPGAGDALVEAAARIAAHSTSSPRVAPEAIDYVGLFDRDRMRAAAGKARASWKGRR